MYKKIDTPIFNRDGFYFDRKLKKSWVEGKFGAYDIPIDGFKNELEYLEYKPMMNDEFELIDKLIKLQQKRPNFKHLINKYYSHLRYSELNSIMRNTTLMMRSVLKKD